MPDQTERDALCDCSSCIQIMDAVKKLNASVCLEKKR